MKQLLEGATKDAFSKGMLKVSDIGIRFESEFLE